MRLIKLELEISSNKRVDFGVREPITEFYSTSLINDIHLGGGGSIWTKGKCTKLQESWYKIEFYKNNPLLPLHLSVFHYKHFFKDDDEQWPDIYVLAAESKNNYVIPSSLINENNEISHEGSYKCTLCEIQTDKITALIFELGLNHLTENQIYLDRCFDYISEIEQVSNINSEEWIKLTLAEFTNWFDNIYLNEKNEVLTPEFDFMQNNSLLRIKKRHSAYLEELIAKACHPSRLSQTDNFDFDVDNTKPTIDNSNLSSNKRKRTLDNNTISKCSKL